MVDTAEQLDATAATVDAARREVVEAYADQALGRARPLRLEEVCAKLGLDADRVRARSADLRREE